MRSNSSRSNSCSKQLNSRSRDSQFYTAFPLKKLSQRRQRGRSQSLERQEKYPPLITPLKSKPAQQQHVWTLIKSDIIEQKSEVEEDENLQKMIQEIQAQSQPNSMKSQFQISSSSPTHGYVYYDCNLQCEPANSQSRNQSVIQMEEEDSSHNYDERKFFSIIQQCLVFWKREQFNEYDNKKFYQLIKKYVLIHFRPAPLNELGEKLLQNGFFILAFIKYMSSRNVDHGIRTMLFDSFKKSQNQIIMNYEQFLQAYNSNLKQNSDRQFAESNRPSRVELEEETYSNQYKRQDSGIFRAKESLKRKFSGQFSREYSYRSRDKPSGKEYKDTQLLVVKRLVSGALGSLRQFLLVETENKNYQLPQFIVIPKKKQQTINSTSLNQALYQAQQITRSHNIFFFRSPGPQFNQVYNSMLNNK